MAAVPLGNTLGSMEKRFISLANGSTVRGYVRDIIFYIWKYGSLSLCPADDHYTHTHTHTHTRAHSYIYIYFFF
jgi:hypothetical protein